MKSYDNHKGPKQRYMIIDVLRGFAVLLMIVFHLAFDLSYYRFVNIDFFEDPIWFGLPRFIVFLFLVCVGMGLAILHKDEIVWGKVRKRFIKIGGCALFITLTTYVLFPKNFIFFGTLHCIAVTSVIGVFFVKKPKLSLVLCILLLTANMVFKPTLIPVSAWLDVTPMDYIPVFPWIGVVFFGIYLESVNFHKISLKRNRISKGFEIIGRHSLPIYLVG